ncbi:BTB/POZ domain-containing protein [Stagonosporopsis vannaccii]|nr:BTB/POZ domain-containing protein [Stagonosporopsis vannaccii]
MDLLAMSASRMYATPVIAPLNVIKTSKSNLSWNGSDRAVKTYVTGSHFSADSSPATSTLDLTRSRASSNASNTSSSTYSAQSVRSSKHSRNASTSTTASSTPSVGSTKRPRHLRALSDSMHITRRLQKKPSSQQVPQRQSDPMPVPTAMLTPVTILGPERIVDIQQSDLLVRCRDDDYHVDRSIMCHHSLWFSKVYSKVNYPKMSKRIVDLSAEDPYAVAAMIQYCYQLDYGDTRLDSNSALYRVIALRPHLDTYLLAERYGMPGLQKLAAQKYEKLGLAVLTSVGDEEEFVQSAQDLYAPSRRTRADELRRIASAMDRHDQRKRTFSETFQLANLPRLGNNHAQSAKRISSCPLNSTDLWHQGFDRENEIPLNLNGVSAFDDFAGTQIRHPASVDPRYADPLLYSHESMHYERYTKGPGPEIQSDTEQCPPPVLRDRRLGDVSQSTQVNADSPISNATTEIGPLSPSGLNFGDLSLNSRDYSVPSSPNQIDIHGHRTTVTAVPTSSFADCYPEIHPNEVLIVFDKGRATRKVDRYPLCAASRFFSQLLNDPFLAQGLTRRVRLRDDFPHAVTIMLHFIETGHYVFDRLAFDRFPTLTTLDLHIHAYLASIKYGITALRDCVIAAYLSIAECELELGFLLLSGDQYPNLQVVAPGFPVFAPAETHGGVGMAITPIDRFLNSLVLLWRNTSSRYDAMRKAVLELIKRVLNKLLRVPFFVTLMKEMVGFGDDIVANLEDDGFEVEAYQVTVGARHGHTVRFGV